MSAGSKCRYRLGRAMTLDFILVTHVGDRQSGKQLLNAVMNLPQGFPYITAAGHMTVTVLGKTACQKDRPVDSPDHFECRNRRRSSPKTIAAVGAVLRLQKTRSSQRLEDLGQKRKGDTISICYLLRARTTILGGEVLEGDEPVIRLLGQLEHTNTTDLVRHPYTTPGAAGRQAKL